jgi:hypothetical protein
MPASEAQIKANSENARRSTGPVSEQGKQKSRANSLKHGLTGAGVVLVRADAAEVERRAASFAIELYAAGDVGLALARRAALNSVRMERAADQQEAALLEHVRKLDEEFVAPEGLGDDEIARLRQEAARRSMFDDSKAATLARKYEAAAERAFFRCLKELKQMEGDIREEAQVDPAAQAAARLGSFLRMQETFQREDDEFDSFCEELEKTLPTASANSPHPYAMRGMVDMMIAPPPRR